MLSLSLLLALAAPAAHASPVLRPQAGEKSCLVREYSAAHLERNPKQFLSKMHILLEREPVAIAPAEAFTSAKIVGEKDGKLYGNEASCEYKPDGKTFCFVECDGGSFSLRTRGKREKRGYYFEISKDYYFPLFKQGADPENARNSDTLSFDDKDQDNRLYRLDEQDTRVCEERWQQFKEVPPFGC